MCCFLPQAAENKAVRAAKVRARTIAAEIAEAELAESGGVAGRGMGGRGGRGGRGRGRGLSARRQAEADALLGDFDENVRGSYLLSAVSVSVAAQWGGLAAGATGEGVPFAAGKHVLRAVQPAAAANPPDAYLRSAARFLARCHPRIKALVTPRLQQLVPLPGMTVPKPPPPPLLVQQQPPAAVLAAMAAGGVNLPAGVSGVMGQQLPGGTGPSQVMFQNPATGQLQVATPQLIAMSQQLQRQQQLQQQQLHQQQQLQQQQAAGAARPQPQVGQAALPLQNQQMLQQQIQLLQQLQQQAQQQQSGPVNLQLQQQQQQQLQQQLQQQQLLQQQLQ